MISMYTVCMLILSILGIFTSWTFGWEPMCLAAGIGCIILCAYMAITDLNWTVK